MSYEDERPAEWTPYDRIMTAVDDARSMLQSNNIKDRFEALLGAANYQRMLEYFACVDLNIEKIRWIMGRLHLTSERAPDDRAVAMRLIEQSIFDELTTALNPRKEGA